MIESHLDHYSNEMLASHQSGASGAAGKMNQNNEHNINVVIRVRPIITSQRTSTNKSIIQHEQQQSSTDQSRQPTVPAAAHHHHQQQHDGTAESDADQSTAITFPAAGQIQVEDTIANVPRSFAFNVVFEPEATQEEVFEHSGVKRLIDMALDGFACTVFAYGQTSTGKTYTLTGNAFQYSKEEPSSSSSSSGSWKKNNSLKKETKNYNNNHKMNEHENDAAPPPPTTSSSTRQPSVKNIGIVQLTFAYLFEQIKRRKLRDKTLYVITVSYLEVYNEQVLDLLNPSPRCLNVRWAKDRGFYAENLFKVECEDLGDLEGVLEEGCKNRQVRSHSMNENSSRSHSVMTITLFSEIADPEDPQGFIRKEGRLCLVDLAGSEKTKRTNSKGGTFVEANNINRSLLVLGNCIACLADPKRRNGHIPYRDSTLTKLLADSLSGNGMTLMIACISPLKCDSQETISTLRYASRAKRVRMNPVVQMDPRELLILSLKREVRMLKMENNYLRQNCHQIWNDAHQDASNHQASLPSHPLGLGDGSLSMSHPSKDSTNNKSIQQNKDEESLLNKYMKENEVLRVENVQMNLQRNRLVRDHELVCRENEQLLRKLNLLLYKLNSSEANKQHCMTSTGMPNALASNSQGLFSSASSPSILSLAYEDELKDLRDHNNSQVSQVGQMSSSLSNTTAINLNNAVLDDDGDVDDAPVQQDNNINNNNAYNIIRNQKVSLPSAVSGSQNVQAHHHITNNNQNRSQISSNHPSTNNQHSADQAKQTTTTTLAESSNTLDLTIRGKSAVSKTRLMQSNQSKRHH